MRITEKQLRRIIRKELIREGADDVVMYRVINGDLIVTPKVAFSDGSVRRALGRALQTGDRAAGEALLRLIRTSAGQYFSDSISGIEPYVRQIAARGGSPTIYRVTVPRSIATEAGLRGTISSMTAAGGSGTVGTATNYVLEPAELFRLNQAGKVTVVEGAGKVITASSDAAMSSVMRRLTAEKFAEWASSAARAGISGLKSGLISGIKGIGASLFNPYALAADFLGMASAPYIYAATTGTDLEQSKKDIETGGAAVWGFIKGMWPGGLGPLDAAHKEAYDTWADQLRATGRQIMTWEEQQELLKQR
jgi:hypothetical protein